MVVFTCNHCGESLQKPRVEKHYQTVCRRPKSLTCVDCFKDFKGDEFNVHIKCITEEERYAAKGAFQGGIVKKGEVKQESWVDMIRSIITKEPNLAPKTKSLLETVSTYTNIPRKKNKFVNFMKSSSGGRVDMRVVEDVWNLIEKYKTQTSPENAKAEKDTENAAKRKLEDNTDETEVKKMKTENGEVQENGAEKKKKKKKKSKGKDAVTEEIVESEKQEENKSADPEENKCADPEENKVEKMIVDSEETNGGKKKRKKNKKKKSEEGNCDNSTNGVDKCEDHTKNGVENHVDDKGELKEKKNECDDKENTDEVGQEGAINGDTEKSAFSFDEAILNILNKKKTIPLKKLQKKVLNSFIKHNGLTEATEKHTKKFLKKLNKMQTVKVESDNVVLVE